MNTKKFTTNARPVILSLLLAGCATNPSSFNGKHVLYQTDPAFTSIAKLTADAQKQCDTVGKKAVYERQDCPPGRACITSYRCE